MGIFEQLKKQRENGEILRRKRELLEALGNGNITKAQYDFEMANIELSLEEKEFNKNRLTPGKIATKAASSLVKATVNGLLGDLSPFGSSDKTKR